MNKRLSRNKSIKALHDLTWLSYKDCRARLKNNSWVLNKALFDFYGVKFDNLDKVIKACSNFLDEFNKALQEAFIPLVKSFTESLTDVVKQLDVEQAFTDSEKPDYLDARQYLFEPVNNNAVIRLEEVNSNDN